MSKISEGGPQEIIYVPWDHRFLNDVNHIKDTLDLNVRADSIRLALKKVPHMVLDAVPQEQIDAELAELLTDPDAPTDTTTSLLQDPGLTLLDTYVPSESDGHTHVRIDRIDLEAITLAARLCHLDIGSFAHAATRYYAQISTSGVNK